jgi:hypothetical protein
LDGFYRALKTLQAIQKKRKQFAERFQLSPVRFSKRRAEALMVSPNGPFPARENTVP